jgi:hypothetical protein
MRDMTDSKGIIVRPESVTGDDAYAGMLEGTPYLARRFRLIQGRNAMTQPGVLVYGLDELEREIEVTSRDTDLWAPNERWTARLVSDVDYKNMVRHYMLLTWYQRAEDPMQRLSDIVKTLDFRRHSQQETVDID